MATKETSSKYTLIKKASSNKFVAIVIASVIVSFSVVTIKFLMDLQSFNGAVSDEQKQVIQVLENNIANFEQLSEEYENFETGPDLIQKQGDRSNTTTVFDALPSKYDYPAVVTALENLSRTSGVDLAGISGRDESESAIESDPNPEPIAIPITVSLNGDYQSIQRFLTNLERTIRPYEIRLLQISGSDEDLRATVEMMTFYQPSIDVSEEVKRSITR